MNYYSVLLNLIDGQSSLSLAYFVSISLNLLGSEHDLNSLVLDKIAEEQGWEFNGEYYETVGMCGLQVNRIEQITLQEYSVFSQVLENFSYSIC